MTASSPPVRRRPPRVLFRVLNPLFRLLLRSPWHGKLSQRLLLLTFTGRKSGRRYTTPVGYVQIGDTVLMATQSGWQKNLAGAHVSLRLRGRQHTGTAEVIADEAGMIECYRAMLPQAPHYAQVVGLRLDPDGRPNRDDVARARQAGHVVVRVRLDDETAPSPATRPSTPDVTAPPTGAGSGVPAAADEPAPLEG